MEQGRWAASLPHGYPITPPALRHPLMEVALVKHAVKGRDEIQHLADEFLLLARQTTGPTPAIDRLYPYLDPATPPLPAGSAKIPLDLRWLRAALAVASGVLRWCFANGQAHDA